MFEEISTYVGGLCLLTCFSSKLFVYATISIFFSARLLVYYVSCAFDSTIFEIGENEKIS